MDLAYVAHSARCALLLDADGVCRWFVMKVEDESAAAAAKRCVGARFVATLDPDAAGLLGHEPCVGKNVLLARVDDGRVSLVRFGPLVQFERLGDAVEERDAPPAAASQPAVDEPLTAELPRLAVVPASPMSEPATIPGASAIRSDDGDDDAPEPRPPHDLFDEDELATAAGERQAYRSSGFVFLAHATNDGDDDVATSAFGRAVAVRESRRGMLPRRH